MVARDITHRIDYFWLEELLLDRFNNGSFTPGYLVHFSSLLWSSLHKNPPPWQDASHTRYFPYIGFANQSIPSTVQYPPSLPGNDLACPPGLSFLCSSCMQHPGPPLQEQIVHWEASGGKMSIGSKVPGVVICFERSCLMNHLEVVHLEVEMKSR